MTRTCHRILVLAAYGLAVCVARADESPPSAPDSSAAAAPAIDVLGEEACRGIALAYDYDATIPLEARVVEKIDQDDPAREKIVFRGASGQLVPGYLQIPQAAAGPCACVLLLHGWSGSKENWWQDGNYISGGDARKALLAAGFAVLALDAQCHGDRIAENDFSPVNHYVDPSTGDKPRKGYFTQTDIYVQTTRDYRRAIDYLASRPEIDAARIGMLGYSMGGTQTYLLMGVEPRVKVAVAVAVPAEHSKWSIIAPQNFARAVGERPLMSIAGQADPMCSVQHARALAGLTRATTTKQMFFEAGHRLPADYVPHAVAWFREHL